MIDCQEHPCSGHCRCWCACHNSPKQPCDALRGKRLRRLLLRSPGASSVVKPSPQMVKKAARLLVIQCERPGFYHVYDPVTGTTHHLKVSAIGSAICDCEKGQRGGICSHALALKWHLSAASTAKETT